MYYCFRSLKPNTEVLNEKNVTFTYSRRLVICLPDEALRRPDSLRPLCPAAVVNSSPRLRESGLLKCGIDYGGGDTCSAGADYGLGRVDTLLIENFSQLCSRQKCFRLWVEEDRDREGMRVWNMSR